MQKCEFHPYSYRIFENKIIFTIFTALFLTKGDDLSAIHTNLLERDARMVKAALAGLSVEAFLAYRLSGMRSATQPYRSCQGRCVGKFVALSCNSSDDNAAHLHRFTFENGFPIRNFRY